MKRLALIIALLGTCLVVGARERCTTTQTYDANGKLTNCMVCCDARGNCTTSCWQ